MPDRTPLHRALIAAGMTYVGPAEAERVEKALDAMGYRLVKLVDEGERPHAQPVDWDDLLGSAPDATGGMASEAFVRRNREDWR